MQFAILEDYKFIETKYAHILKISCFGLVEETTMIPTDFS